MSAGTRADVPTALPWVAFAAALALYCATLAPGLLWSDSAKLALLVAEGDFLGYGHGQHPLHTLLGLLFALLPASLPYTQNLFSAVCGAGAVALSAAAATRFAPAPAALLAAMALAFSQTAWHYGVINESYALLWLLLAASLLLALRHRERRSDLTLALLGLAAGLGASAHGLLVLALPGLLWLARLMGGGAEAVARRLVLFAAAFAAGAFLLWIGSLAGDAGASRESIGLVESTLAHARLYLRPSRLLREAALFPAYLLYQFPGLGFAAIVLGLAGPRRKDAGTGALLVAVVPIVLFASSYMRQRQFAMLGAAYLLLVPLLAAGLGRILSRFKPALVAPALLLAPVLVYAGAALFGSRHGLPFPVRSLPYRDEARYFLWPPKSHERGAERYLEDARDLLPPRALVIGDFNVAEPLRYAIEAEGSLDLRLLVIVDDLVLQGADPGPALAARIDQELARGEPAVYLADRYEPYYRVSYLGERFRLTELGPFTRVERR